uniref:Uncharacterized protein n=1 Tax=Anguilla anguilla TaxID=7936 RepID=A0A0E9PIL0_ANGAN
MLALHWFEHVYCSLYAAWPKSMWTPLLIRVGYCSHTHY